MREFLKRYYLLLLIFIGGALYIMFFIFTFFPQKSSRPPIQSILPDINVAPTLPPGQGIGIDVSSSPVQDSIKQIELLKPYLPYKNTVTTSSGKAITIIIPSYSMQINPWTLVVNILEIDYQVPPGSDEYNKEKDNFKQAADALFAWMSDKGIEPKKIYISWGNGDAQEQAERWLTE